MPLKTGGEATVEALIAHGVDTLFGLPGVQNDWLYNALFDNRDQIRVIHTRHEEGAAYMAFGAAAATGEPAVFSVVSGPGLLNAGAALASAFAVKKSARGHRTSSPVAARRNQGHASAHIAIMLDGDKEVSQRLYAICILGFWKEVPDDIGRSVFALDRSYFVHRQMVAEAFNGEDAIHPGDEELDRPGGVIRRTVEYLKDLRSIAVGPYLPVGAQ